MRFNPERLRRARQTYPMTREQLAVHMEVSLNTIDRWETGKTEPTASQLAFLAKRLDRDVKYFLRGAA